MVLTKTKKIISLPRLMKKAVKVFNQYIRLRDANSGCISCHSQKVDHASHFFSSGKYPSLRFSEDNVSGSCASCNTWMHGNLLEYRMKLLRKIGQQRMDMLESTATRNKFYKWQRFELEEIYKIYKNKVAEMLYQ